MKAIILIVVLSAIIAMNLTAQNQLPILVGKKEGRTTYQQNGKYLTKKELSEVLNSNTESIKEYNESASMKITAGIFIVPGIISLCTGVVYASLSRIAIVSDNRDLASKYQTTGIITLLSGLGLTIIGCTIAAKSEAHITKSINNYTLKTGRIENGIIYFGFTGEGVGVRLRF
jgi:hypothetical protein